LPDNDLRKSGAPQCGYAVVTTGNATHSTGRSASVPVAAQRKPGAPDEPAYSATGGDSSRTKWLALRWVALYRSELALGCNQRASTTTGPTQGIISGSPSGGSGKNGRGKSTSGRALRGLKVGPFDKASPSARPPRLAVILRPPNPFRHNRTVLRLSFQAERERAAFNTGHGQRGTAVGCRHYYVGIGDTHFPLPHKRDGNRRWP
jgi:hypothetical protein